MTKKKGNLWIDSIFATIFILLFMLALQTAFQKVNLEGFDVIGEALSDMEITDYGFSKLREPLPPDTNIVLVNIGNLPRSGIAEQLRIIDSYRPKVIGIDSFFKGKKEDSLGDLSLANAIGEAKSEIVMVAKVDQSDSLQEVIGKGEEIYDLLYKSDSAYSQHVHLAIANLDTDAKYQADVKICRKFPPQRTLTTGETYIAFGAKVAQVFDPASTGPLLERGKENEIVNYRGDFMDFYSENVFATRFYALDWYQVLQEDFVPELIKDKIVILGFLGAEFGDEQWEDKFFTPLNSKIAGRANPDMYGSVIHANIVSMVLNRDYVDNFSLFIEYVLGILVLFINVVLFSMIYHRMGAWYDGIAKLIQLFEVIALTLTVIYVFSFYNFKMDLAIAFFGVALVGDLLEIYFGVIKNLLNKKNMKKLLTLSMRFEIEGGSTK